MPDALVRVAGRTIGLAFHTFDRAHRRIAQRNLERAFPMRPAAERRAIARGTFIHFGRLLLELLKFSTLSPEGMLARVEFDGEERVRLAYAQGRGVLFSRATSGSGRFTRSRTRCGSSRLASLRARWTTNG